MGIIEREREREKGKGDMSNERGAHHDEYACKQRVARETVRSWGKWVLVGG